MSFDPVKLAQELAAKVKAALSPIEQRLSAVEARTPLVGEKGQPGDPGRDGTDGAPGRDGIDGKAGADGLNGKDGIAGKDGRDGIDGKDGAPGLNGKDGTDGLHGKDGRDGIDGKDGADGRDGAGITTASIDAEGKLVVVYTDGRTEKVGLVVGKDGRDGRDGQAGVPGRWGEAGKDGVDGLGFDDVSVEFDGERSFSLSFHQGERKKTFGAFRLPVPIYRGVFSEGRTYEACDMVTWGGSVFVAKMDTAIKPDEHGAAAKAWQLCVKRGQQGKPGEPSK